MVKIAVVGAGSSLGREVIDKLVEGGQHEVLALVRKDPSQYPQQANVKWAQASFQDKSELVEHLRGMEVVLSFIVVNEDSENTVGKLVVDAAVAAGVKRFAPSEWATGQKLHDAIDGLPFYRSKLALQAYLRELNKEKKVIEYTLFQPGVFLDYLGYPHQLNKYLPALDSPWLVNDLRIVSVKGHEDEPLTFTAASDIANVVRRAIEYEGEWPEVGGIKGNQTSPHQLQKIIEEIRKKPVKLDLAEREDLDAGALNVDLPPMAHPVIPEHQRTAFHVPLWVGLLRSTALGAWNVTDEWNRLLPDYKFVTIEDYLEKVWGEK